MPKLCGASPSRPRHHQDRRTTREEARRRHDGGGTSTPGPRSNPGQRSAAPTKVRVNTLGDIAGRESGGLIVLLVAVGALTLASPEFLTGNNLANLARQVAIFGILAIGQLLVILTGGIDLSVGSVLGLSGAVTAQLLVAGVPIIPAILIGVVVGGALGIANGLLVTRFKLPPFIATLGMLGIARGIVLVITDAKTIQGLPEASRPSPTARSWESPTC